MARRLARLALAMLAAFAVFIGGGEAQSPAPAPHGRKLTLDGGMVLVVPPTLKLDQNTLSVGARITAHYEDQGGSHVVTTIRREPS